MLESGFRRIACADVTAPPKNGRRYRLCMMCLKPVLALDIIEGDIPMCSSCAKREEYPMLEKDAMDYLAEPVQYARRSR